MREIGSGVEPGREQVGGSGGEESALEFPGNVSAAFRARFGAPGGTKGDHATEDEPVAATRPFKKGAAVAKRRLGRRFDLRGRETAPDFLQARADRRLHFPNGIEAPEKTEAPAVHAARLLVDFDVAMHDDHEGAEDIVRATIGRARVGDQMAAVVNVGGRRVAHLVCPVSGATLTIPVIIMAWRNGEGNEMAFLGTPGRDVH